MKNRKQKNRLKALENRTSFRSFLVRRMNCTAVAMSWGISIKNTKDGDND